MLGGVIIGDNLLGYSSLKIKKKKVLKKPTEWNAVNMQGVCSLTILKGREYYLLVQEVAGSHLWVQGPPGLTVIWSVQRIQVICTIFPQVSPQ